MQNQPCGVSHCGVSQGQVLLVSPCSSPAALGTSIFATAGLIAAPLLFSLRGQGSACPGLWWHLSPGINPSSQQGAQHKLSFCPTDGVKEQPDCRAASCLCNSCEARLQETAGTSVLTKMHHLHFAAGETQAYLNQLFYLQLTG